VLAVMADAPESWRKLYAAVVLEVVRPGETRLPGPLVSKVGRVVLTLVIVTTNVVGAAAVVVLAAFVLPLPLVSHPGHVRTVNEVAAIIYVAIAVPVGVLLGTYGMRHIRHWLEEERRPTLQEARVVLRAPLQLFRLQVSLWVVGAIVFG